MWLMLTTMSSAVRGQQSESPRPALQNSCQQIAVMGAVRNPSRLDVPSSMRLFDILARVGGPTERAGKIIRVVHSCKCERCSQEEKAKEVHEYSLAEVLRGRESENPKVNPGDIVVVPETELVYVMGNARRLTNIVFREGLHVSQAIAMAGGTGSSDDRTTIRIHRVSSDKGYQNLFAVSLKAIQEGRAEDVLLQPRDFVTVSDVQGSSLSPLIGYPTIIRDPPLIPRDYRVICNLPQFKDLQPKVCQFVP